MKVQAAAVSRRSRPVQAIEPAVRQHRGIGHVVIATADDGFVGDGAPGIDEEIGIRLHAEA